MTPSELYATTRFRIADVVGDLDEEGAARRVPGCPEWSVRDVVAHLVGIVADVEARGWTDNVGDDAWTQAQVDARAAATIPALLAEWERHGATFEPRLDEAPKWLHRMLLTDLVTHEHDVRGALGRPGGREGEPYEIARKAYAVGLAKALDERGLPGLTLAADDWSFDAGAEPVATVRVADSFELFRALAGRRSRGQVLAYDWSADPAPYLPVLNHFGALPETDVVEAG